MIPIGLISKDILSEVVPASQENPLKDGDFVVVVFEDNWYPGKSS